MSPGWGKTEENHKMEANIFICTHASHRILRRLLKYHHISVCIDVYLRYTHRMFSSLHLYVLFYLQINKYDYFVDILHIFFVNNWICERTFSYVYANIMHMHIFYETHTNTEINSECGHEHVMYLDTKSFSLCIFVEIYSK